MRLGSLWLVLGIVAVAGCLAAGVEEKEPEIFEPTHEWKEVLDHQQVPGVRGRTVKRGQNAATWNTPTPPHSQGLAIRMDLAEGKKYAKLMDSADDKGSSVALAVDGTGGVVEAVVPDTAEVAPAEPDAVDDMMRVMGSLPEPDESFRTLLAQKDSLSRGELGKRMRELWARRQEELREAMASMKSEAQQMADLLTSLLAEDTTLDTRLELLEDLTFHVGKVDNARDFAGMGGLQAVAFLLNDTMPQVQAAAAVTLGTTVRYEAALQAAALELGVMPVLTANMQAAAERATLAANTMRVAPSMESVEARAFKQQVEVAKRSIFAAGALMRGNPDACRAFTAGGGRAALTAVLGVMAPPHGHNKWVPRAWHSAPDFVGTRLMQLMAKGAILLGDITAEAQGAPKGGEGDTPLPSHMTLLPDTPEVDPEQLDTPLGTQREVQRTERDALLLEQAARQEENPPPPPDHPLAGMYDDAMCGQLGQALAMCLWAGQGPSLPCPPSTQEALFAALAHALGGSARALHRQGGDISVAGTMELSGGLFEAPQCGVPVQGPEAAPWVGPLYAAVSRAAEDVREGTSAFLASREAFEDPLPLHRAVLFVASTMGLDGSA